MAGQEDGVYGHSLGGVAVLILSRGWMRGLRIVPGVVRGGPGSRTATPYGLTVLSRAILARPFTVVDRLMSCGVSVPWGARGTGIGAATPYGVTARISAVLARPFTFVDW